MKEIADASGSQIIFINPARNLRDQSPFKSEHGTSLSKDQLAEWQQRFDQGNYLLKQNSPE